MRIIRIIGIGFLLLFAIQLQSQDNKLQIAIEKLPTELRVQFIKEQLAGLYKIDSARANRQVVELLKHFGNNKQICATINLCKGKQLFKMFKSEEALYTITNAEKMLVEIKDEEGEFEAIASLIFIYRELNRSNEIIQIIIKKLSETENNPKRECILCEKLGIIFKDQGNFDKALEYFRKAEEKFDLIENPKEDEIKIQITINRNIGVLYRNKGDFEKSLFYLNKALALAESNSDNLKAAVLNSLGTLYKLRKEYYKAIKAYEESLKIKAENDNLSGLSTTYVNLSSLYLEINNFLRAEQFGLKAYEFGSLSKDRTKIMDACENISKIYETMNKREKAFPFMKRANQLRDSVNKSSIVEQSAKLEAQYDSEKKRKEIEFGKLKNQQLQESVNARSRERNMVFASSLVLLVMMAFVVKSYFDKKRANNLLEDKNKLIIEQKYLVEEQHKEILDSITYAKRLQEAILPSEKELKRILKDYFIYYKPKSIVAGDFYWMEVFGEIVLVAVADCTGHGVPGAMVSIVCSNALNRSVHEFGIREPGKILDKTRELVLENFGKNQSDVKDGMDISLVSINIKSNEIKWAGANNPLWFIKSGSFCELMANKQPIGKADNYLPFTTHSIQLKAGDTLFLFSDGYADQFGGPKEKKLKQKQMKEVLTEKSQESLTETELKVRTKFEEWKGELEQVDDVCVLGIRLCSNINL